MSGNDCFSMLLSCCFCCSMCSSSSDSSTLRFCIGLFPESWCKRFDDTAAEDAQMAERDREADLFHNAQQPQSTAAMDDKKSAAIRDKSLIMSDE